MRDDVKAVAQARDSGMAEEFELGVDWFPGAAPQWQPILRNMMSTSIRHIYGDWKSLTPDQVEERFYQECISANAD